MNVVALICLFVGLFVSFFCLPVRLFLVLSPCSRWHVHVLWWNLPRICSCFVFQSFLTFQMFDSIYDIPFLYEMERSLFLEAFLPESPMNSGLSVYTAVTSLKAVFQFVFPDVWDDVPGNRIGKNLLFRFFVGNVGP